MCTTASAFLRCELYVEGLKMSPFAHVTDLDQGGGSEDEVTADHDGSPERLSYVSFRNQVELEKRTSRM